VTEKDKRTVYFACEEMSKCVCSSNFRLEKEKWREKKDVNTITFCPVITYN